MSNGFYTSPVAPDLILHDLESYISSQSINSDVVIACIDAFFPAVDKPMVIVTDQASIHTSDAIIDKIEEWKQSNISLFKLQFYYYELNWIEILWRFIKYEWIEISAYKNWEAFVASIEKNLKEFGENYVINFVWLLTLVFFMYLGYTPVYVRLFHKQLLNFQYGECWCWIEVLSLGIVGTGANKARKQIQGELISALVGDGVIAVAPAINFSGKRFD